MKIGKIKGISISLHISTLLIIGLVGFYAADFYAILVPGSNIFELIIVGLINGLIMLFSILIHELTHSLIAQKYGLKVSEIDLYLFGGVSKIEQEPNTPRSDFIISIFGPISSLLIGVIFLGVLYLVPITLPPFLKVTLFYSGISNIGLGLFNLIPAYPMDGGRALRAILWNKRHDLLSATKTASKVGSFIAYGLMAYGFISMFFLGFLNGLWLIIIASFLNNQSRHAYYQTFNELTLSKLSAKQLVRIADVAIPFNKTVSEAITSYFIPYKKVYFPVIYGGNVVGIIHLEDIKKVPVNQRNEIIVGYLMKKVSQFPTLSQDETGKNVLMKLNQMRERPHLIIVKDINENKIIGYIGEDDILTSLKFLQNRI
ncbi:MAG: site-2 protease family protein [Candidatus Hermodarchaeota archaeon]